MDLNIGRDTLLALAAIAWADGQLGKEEAEGIRGAAQQLSLGAEDAALLEQALTRPITLDEVETVRMARLTRLFTYAVACWVTTLDGRISSSEQAALDQLGDRLGLSSVARDRARSVAENLALSTAPSARYDLVKLRSTLSAGLSRIGDD